MDPPDSYLAELDAELSDTFLPFNVPPAVVELEIPTTSRAMENASPPLLVGYSHDLCEPPSTSRTLKHPPSSTASSVSDSNPSSSTPTPSSSKRRRQYEPDPIRGTSQHTMKRARNNAAVRKSRAKASEGIQVQEGTNTERLRQTALYRDARVNITEMVRIFKQNIFERNPGKHAQQRHLCQELVRINDELKEKGLAVPNLDEM